MDMQIFQLSEADFAAGRLHVKGLSAGHAA